MRVLVSGGLKTDAITRAMEKAFSDGSVLFTSENFIKNIESFLSRGNYFDRAIIMEQSITENGNVLDNETISKVVQKLVELINTKLLQQEILFVLNTEAIANIVSSEVFLVSDRMKVLLYTSKERYKVALFKALALTSFSELSTNINTKNLLYTQKEVETTEVYNEDYTSTASGDEVVVNMDEDTNLDTPENFSGSLFDDESIPTDMLNASSTGDDLNELSDAFDRPQELGSILNGDNLDFGDIPTENVINEDITPTNIDDIGNIELPDNAAFNMDTFGDDFGDGIETSEQTNANKYEDMFTGVEEPDVTEESPVQQNPITFDDNINNSNNGLGIGDFSAETSVVGNELINGEYTPENDVQDQFDFPDSLGDNFNDNTVGNDTSLIDTQGGLYPSDNSDTNLGLFDSYSDTNNETPSLENYFGDPEQSDLEVDESLNTQLDDPYLDNNTMPNNMVNNVENNPNIGIANQIPNNQPLNNQLPNNQVKQKKGFFGLVKKKNNTGMVVAAGAGVAAGTGVMNNMQAPNNMPMVNNMPVVQKPGKKAKLSKSNNTQNSMLSTQVPTQVTIDPTRVRDDELITMMNSYKIRGNCMVITGTSNSGSSTMAANLANVISKMGYTVLLVDMDNIGRSQAYMTKEVYSTIHSTDPSNNSLRLSINNKTGEVSRYATIVREGLNLITTGLAVDFEDLTSIIRDGRMLQNFIYGAKATYNFVIFDTQFTDLTGFLKELVLNADSLVLNVKPNNKGLVEFMLKMGNIDDIRVREDMFRRSGIVFNMATNNRNVLGYKVKDYSQMLDAIDKVTEELTGYTGEQSFGQIRIFNEIAFNPIFDNYVFGKEFFSDTKEGSNLYKNILRSILINK